MYKLARLSTLNKSAFCESVLCLGLSTPHNLSIGSKLKPSRDVGKRFKHLGAANLDNAKTLRREEKHSTRFWTKPLLMAAQCWLDSRILMVTKPYFSFLFVFDISFLGFILLFGAWLCFVFDTGSGCAASRT